MKNYKNLVTWISDRTSHMTKKQLAIWIGSTILLGVIPTLIFSRLGRLTIVKQMREKILKMYGNEQKKKMEVQINKIIKIYKQVNKLSKVCIPCRIHGCRLSDSRTMDDRTCILYIRFLLCNSTSVVKKTMEFSSVKS